MNPRMSCVVLPGFNGQFKMDALITRQQPGGDLTGPVVGPAPVADSRTPAQTLHHVFFEIPANEFAVGRNLHFLLLPPTAFGLLPAHLRRHESFFLLSNPTRFQ